MSETGKPLPPGLVYVDDDPLELAVALGASRDRLLGALAGETTQHALALLPRWRWFKRWRLTRMLKKLVDQELAYRGN